MNTSQRVDVGLEQCRGAHGGGLFCEHWNNSKIKTEEGLRKFLIKQLLYQTDGIDVEELLRLCFDQMNITELLRVWNKFYYADAGTHGTVFKALYVMGKENIKYLEELDKLLEELYVINQNDYNIGSLGEGERIRFDA